jgi:hypothetical protein
MAGSDTAVSLAEIIDCAFYLLGRSIVEHMTKAKQNEKIAIPEFACKAAPTDAQQRRRDHQLRQ